MSRLFVAIDLPQGLKTAIANLNFGVQGAKWVPMDQLHLTLRFIGDTDDRTYQDIVESLATVHLPSFSLDIAGAGYFPPRGRPRILWVGIRPNENLTELQRQVEDALIKTGVEPDRRKFHPHITIARLKERSRVDNIIPFLSCNNMFAYDGVLVDEFHLYSSILKPQGAIHRREATFRL
ncbi:MAG: RNA 2',3'-cyclic phosphodiesterase [Chitinispirillaceae bacterium]